MFSNERIISIFFILMVIGLIAGCRTSNSPPYAVIGPAEAYFEQGIGAEQTESLITEAPGDPDGDSVTFESGTLPTGVTLDQFTGVISVIGAPYTGSDYTEDITVWTEDEHGLKSEEFVITLHFTTS